MSLEATKAVWEHSKARGGELLLLLAIADCADKHGFAFPKLPFLCARLRCDERNVRRYRQRLREMGEVIQGEDIDGRTTYQIASMSPDEFVRTNHSDVRTDLTEERTNPTAIRTNPTEVSDKSDRAIRKNYQGTINNYQEQGEEPPRNDDDFCSSVEAAQNLLLPLAVSGPQWLNTLIGCVDVVIDRQRCTRRVAMEFLLAQWELYESRHGPKQKVFWFRDCDFLKPNGGLDSNGTHQSNGNQPRTAQARRVAALYSSLEEAERLADGPDGSPVEPSWRT